MQNEVIVIRISVPKKFRSVSKTGLSNE